MYTKQPKKLIIMNILDILKKYTDERCATISSTPISSSPKRESIT